MKYLLDTHIFIWAMEASKSIPAKTKLLLKDSANEVFVSVATVWEVVIKKSKGKLHTPRDIEGEIHRAGFKILPIEIAHVLGIETLPFYHKDPFDRLLVSQARAENLTLITSDEKIWKYNVSLLKA